jgi:hypothetical protein
MNRSQYEAIHGSQKREPCSLCNHRRNAQQKRREIRIAKAIERNNAINAAVKSGKLIQVWFQDEFTGWHYINYKNHNRMTGRGS